MRWCLYCLLIWSNWLQSSQWAALFTINNRIRCLLCPGVGRETLTGVSLVLGPALICERIYGVLRLVSPFCTTPSHPLPIQTKRGVRTHGQWSPSAAMFKRLLFFPGCSGTVTTSGRKGTSAVAASWNVWLWIFHRDSIWSLSLDSSLADARFLMGRVFKMWLLRGPRGHLSVLSVAFRCGRLGRVLLEPLGSRRSALFAGVARWLKRVFHCWGQVLLFQAPLVLTAWAHSPRTGVGSGGTKRSTWVRRWLVTCVLIQRHGKPKSLDAGIFPPCPCFCCSGHLQFLERSRSWCQRKRLQKWVRSAVSWWWEPTRFGTAVPWCRHPRCWGWPSGCPLGETESKVQGVNTFLMLYLRVRCCLKCPLSQWIIIAL